MTGGIVVTILIMVVVLGFLAWSSDKYAAFWYKILVNDRFEVINMIQMTEDVPGKWRIKFLESLIRKNSSSSFWRQSNRLLQRWYVFRLGQLIKAIKNLAIIKEADRLEYIEVFDEIRAEWRARINEI